jgi:hypothetical protein
MFIDAFFVACIPFPYHRKFQICKAMHLKARAMIKSGKKAGAGCFTIVVRPPSPAVAPDGGSKRRTVVGHFIPPAFSGSWQVKNKPRWIPWLSFLFVNY